MFMCITVCSINKAIAGCCQKEWPFKCLCCPRLLEPMENSTIGTHHFQPRRTDIRYYDVVTWRCHTPTPGLHNQHCTRGETVASNVYQQDFVIAHCNSSAFSSHQTYTYWSTWWCWNLWQCGSRPTVHKLYRLLSPVSEKEWVGWYKSEVIYQTRLCTHLDVLQPAEPGSGQIWGRKYFLLFIHVYLLNIQHEQY